MAFEKLVFRVHALRRMFQRQISETDVKQALRVGKKIEDYPKDEPYPSYLVLCFINHRPIHIVAADNKDDQVTIIITAYEPESDRWDKAFEKRRSPK